MADVKISALPAASTPLAGTEVLPIVQGGTTDKVSVANLTAGRTVDAAAVVVGAGNVSVPSVTFSGDTNTGIYSPAADTIAFTEGGVEAMRIDASGNVGIGTSSPGNRLEVLSAGGTSQFRVRNDAVTPTAYYDFGRDGTDGFFGFSGAQTTFSGYKWSVNAGTEVMRITNAGNVGIGTTPSYRLHVVAQNPTNNIVQYNVNGTGGSTRSRIGFQDGSTGFAPDFGSVGNALTLDTVGSERMRIDSLGNVGIGTSSPSATLDVAGAIRGNSWIGRANTSAPTADAAIYRPADNTLGFVTGNIERARINPGGELLVGTTNALVGIGDLTTTTGSGLSPAGRLGACQNNEASLYLTRNNSDGRIANFYRNATNVGGISVTTTGTSFNTSSDYRLKENVQPMNNGLATVLALKPVTYAWKANGSYGEGFIAHELQQAIPLAVEGEKDAVDIDGKVVPQAVDYSKIVVHLVAAIQELKAENDALKARVAALEAK